MVRYTTTADDPSSQLIWVDASQPLPHICSSCGMFTHDRVKVKHFVDGTKSTTSTKSAVSGIFHVCLYLFGGPIGWLVAMATSQNDGTKAKSKIIKIKMPQCVLCRGQVQLEVVESKYEQAKYSFLVHPIFADRYPSFLAEQIAKSES